MNFKQKLEAIIQAQNSLVCVGLDSEVGKLPAVVKNSITPQFDFNKAIIEATHDLVCAYKPNSAFYEARGAQGITELKLTCDYLHEHYPAVPIILDAKRADIGNTNEGYAGFAFDYLGADAITLHPYLGSEALKPFLSRADKGCIILCRTSNLGAGELQDLLVEGEPMYKVLARRVIGVWNVNDNCMMVVGATYPNELAEIRKLVGDMYLLVPGIGAQGGEVAKTVLAGRNSQGAGMVINSSRGIIFASGGADFATVARTATVQLRDEINKYRVA